MRVEAVLPFDEYWERYPAKRPSSETQVKKRGDNIWHRDAFGNWLCAPGGFHDERNRDRDLSGHNALIASEFYYFGRDAIPIPAEFHSLLASARGHKNTKNREVISRFWEWIKANASKPGRIGVPFRFPGTDCGKCDCSRAAADGR
jgi:hypothetical protein